MTNEITIITVLNEKTTIGGVNYQVTARIINGRKLVKALVERKQDDGSVVWAHLSHRQHKAESAAISRFAAEIKAAFAAHGK